MTDCGPATRWKFSAAASTLGRVEVLHASPDRSVGKILPGFKKGTIQKDDDVATRFKVG